MERNLITLPARSVSIGALPGKLDRILAVDERNDFAKRTTIGERGLSLENLSKCIIWLDRTCPALLLSRTRAVSEAG
jgi:hypothetical protein